MATETATPDLLTALLEHIRVLLGADHVLYSEWEPERGLVTNLAWTGTLQSPEVSTVGLSHPISLYIDDGVELGSDMFPPLEPAIEDTADPACDAKSRSYLERIAVAREAYVHLPCREGGYHELEVFFRDRGREISDADLAVLNDLGRLATVVIDHSRTADALRASELRYRTLAEQLPAIVYVTNPEGRSSIPNPDGIRHLLGYPPEEWSADPKLFWQRTIHPDDFAQVMSWVEDASPDPPYSIEYRMRRSDGEVIWVRDTALPVLGPNGELVRWQGLIVDITDLVENAERLQASETRYRLLAQQVPALTYFRTVDGVVSTLVGPEHGVTLTGHSPEQWEADPHGTWRAALHPDDREMVIDGYHEAVAQQRPHNVSYRMVTLDGHVLWARDIETEVRGDDGRVLGWHGVTVDVTEIEESGEALRAAEARYRNLVEQVPLVTYLDSSEGIGIYVSPQVEEILEVAVEDWVGSYAAWLDRVHPDDRDDVDRRYRSMLAGGDSFDLEYRVVRRDGSVRWIHDQGRRMAEPAAVAGLIQGVIYDVTDRHRAEQAAERRAGQQRVLAELGLRALSGVERASLVREATRAAAETLGVWAAAVLELTADGAEVEIVAGTGPMAHGVGARRPAGDATAAGYTLMTEAPLISGDLERETRFRVLEEAREVGMRSLICVKIAGTPAPYGVLAVYSTDVRAFTEDEVDYLQATANILATAVERDRTQAALAASEAQRQRVLGELLRSADAERARIATELHDDTIQVMTAALFALDRQIAAHRRGDVAAAEEAAGTLRTTLAEAVERTRRLTFELRPPLLQQRGLVAAVAELLEETQRTTPIRTRLEASVSRHTGDVESLCYRTVQELVGNARKHSRAVSLRVALADQNGSVVAEVADDGIGFDVGRALDRSVTRLHLGLDSAAERVRLAGGSFEIQSDPGVGTTVRFSLPARATG
jgi:PAS domain S-box-containing protein